MNILDVGCGIGQTAIYMAKNIVPEGNVTVRQRYVGDFTSDLDFANFPFDNQRLHFILAAVGLDSQNKYLDTSSLSVYRCMRI